MQKKENVIVLEKNYKILVNSKNGFNYCSVKIDFTDSLSLEFGIDYKFISAFEFYHLKNGIKISSIIIKDCSFINERNDKIPYFEFYLVLSNDIKIKISISVKDKFLYKYECVKILEGLFNEN